MGSSKSRPAANNTETVSGDVRALQKKRRQQVATEFQRLDKEERRRQKAAVQMAALQTPTAPYVPSKTTNRLLQEDYDAEAKRRMQDQLAWDSQTFVLNQLLLSVQFFDNYEREMWQAVERNRQHETQQSRQIEAHCKVVLLPDRLQEAIDRRLRYRPRHGLHKNSARSLHPQTMYVVHENIEVTNAGERSNYSILTDAPIYKLEVDNAVATDKQRPGRRAHVGFVRLRCVEGIHINRMEGYQAPEMQPSRISHEESNSVRDEESDDDEDDDAGDDDESGSKKAYTKHRDSIQIVSAATRRRREQRALSIGSNGKRGSLTPTQQNTQTSSSSSAEHDYAYITSLNVRKPLSAARNSLSNESHVDGQPASATILPPSCFTLEAEASDSENDEYDEDDADSDAENNNHRRQQIHQYLNSKAFLTHFVNVFRDRLGAEIGISAAHLNTATWKGAVISAQPWDVVPALSCPWPNEAFEWMHRQRDIKQNPVTMQRFQWPTPDMVNKVVSFGCLAIPLGYTARTGAFNAQAELEWRLVFPNAERYLEGCLTAAQCKVYVLTKALLQTFVEPFTEGGSAGGGWFGAEHLRAHLFWQCETNYAAWPEDYLGEALVRFLNALLEHIKRQRLPDYFLPKRNLFEHIPERVMVDLHKRIFRITENPVMYTMIALRNLQWIGGDVGGGEVGGVADQVMQLDLMNLYGVMTVDNPLKMVNPNFRRETADDEGEDGGDGEEDEGQGGEAMGAIGYYRRVARDGRVKRRKTRKVRFMEADKMQEESQAAARRASVESIDVRFPIVKHMTQLRRVLIYELFITHYLQLARSATGHRAHNQALIYLKQAARLCSLLADDDRREQAANYAAVIETLQQVVLNERARDADAKPQLPSRDSVREAVPSGAATGQRPAMAGSRVSRVRLAPIVRPNGAYTNLAAMNGGAAVAKVATVERKTPPEVRLIDEDDGLEVKRPQTPIGAISFFDDDDDVSAIANLKKVSTREVLVLGDLSGSNRKRLVSVESDDVTEL